MRNDNVDRYGFSRVDDLLIKTGRILLYIVLLGISPCYCVYVLAGQGGDLYYTITTEDNAGKVTSFQVDLTDSKAGSKSEKKKLKHLRRQYPAATDVRLANTNELRSILYRQVAIWFLIATWPIGFLVAGSMLRKRENKLIALYRIVQASLSVSVEEIKTALDVDTTFIRRALPMINRKGPGFYLLDAAGGSVRRGGLGDLAARCSNCGANVRIATGEAMICSYCQSPLPTIVEPRATRPIASQAPQIEQIESPFSWALFITLIICFWPAAIIYAVNKKT